MTVVGKVSFENSGADIEALKQAIVDLQERVRELELTVFIDDMEIEYEVDPLEEAHQRFAASIRAHREGNS